MKTLWKLLPASMLILATLPLTGITADSDYTKATLPVSASSHPESHTLFSSSDEAVAAFVFALRKEDQKLVGHILGRSAIPYVYSKDKSVSRMSVERFLNAYDEKSSLRYKDDTSAELLVGEQEWPLPFPLIKTGAQWHFDAVAGVEEWKQRRIGGNEIAAIQISLAYADAQREYVLRDRNQDGLLEYAQRFDSTSGQHDGLYWPVAEGEELSPMGEAFAYAHQEAGNKTVTRLAKSYHGYYFKILTRQGSSAPGGAFDYMTRSRLIGGFALIAYPEQYAVTGIKSFIINHQGIVYSKDLGVRTSQLVRKIEAYNPDTSWSKESD